MKTKAHLSSSVKTVPLINIIFTVDHPNNPQPILAQGTRALLLHHDALVVQAQPRHGRCPAGLAWPPAVA